MDDPFHLNRFIVAQNMPGPMDNYEAAVRELHAGRKTSHWVWFVFPQFYGVIDPARASAMSKKFAIRSRDEAVAYLNHDVLGPRLRRCAQLAARSGAVNVNTLMGGYPDDLKLQSSMTLFAEAARGGVDDADFVAVLDRWFRGRRDAKTMKLLRSSSAEGSAHAQLPSPEPTRGRRWLFRRGAITPTAIDTES